MTTNQTIDGVSRELIEKAMLACFEAGFGIPHAELRALLDSEPCAKSQAEPDPMLCKFYDVTDWSGLVRELVRHVAQLQDSAKRNVKPWEDTFPPTLLPAYIERVNIESAAAQHQENPVAVVPELTSELRWILGQMCFQHIHTAQALRLMGHQIARKAEDEQAVTIYWMLGHYLKDPANWRENASAEMKAAAQKA